MASDVSGASRLVEIVLTEEQVGLLSVATGLTLRSNEDENGLIALTEEEQADYERLAVFFTTVAANPQHFPVTGRMASSIKERRAAEKEPKPGAGDTSRSVRNKRKARQERRMSFHKQRRKDRKANAELFNMARADMEKAMQEQQAEVERRQAEIENEPKFDVTDILGNVVIAGVPQSMILPVEPVETNYTVGGHEQFETPTKIILPGSAEHLGVELDNN